MAAASLRHWCPVPMNGISVMPAPTQKRASETHLSQLQLLHLVLDRLRTLLRRHFPEDESISRADLDGLEDLGSEVDALEVSRVQRCRSSGGGSQQRDGEGALRQLL